MPTLCQALDLSDCGLRQPVCRTLGSAGFANLKQGTSYNLAIDTWASEDKYLTSLNWREMYLT